MPELRTKMELYLKPVKFIFAFIFSGFSKFGFLSDRACRFGGFWRVHYAAGSDGQQPRTSLSLILSADNLIATSVYIISIIEPEQISSTPNRRNLVASRILSKIIPFLKPHIPHLHN